MHEAFATCAFKTHTQEPWQLPFRTILYALDAEIGKRGFEYIFQFSKMARIFFDMIDVVL